MANGNPISNFFDSLANTAKSDWHHAQNTAEDVWKVTGNAGTAISHGLGSLLNTINQGSLTGIGQPGSLGALVAGGGGGGVAPASESPTKDISKNTSTGPPITAPFDLVQAMAQYTQPYTNMMDQLLGSTPGKAPTVAQAETAGMNMLGPFLQGLPQGLTQTLTKAIQPEFAAMAGIPTAINTSVQQAPYAGLLTDLVSAARNQLIYGAGIGTPSPPGALGALLGDVQHGGAGIGLGAVNPATATATAPATTPSLPGG